MAAAREAYEKAAAELADAERLQGAWRARGEVVAVYPATYPDPVRSTVMDIVGDSQGRYASAGRAVLRPALEAPTSAAGVRSCTGWATAPRPQGCMLRPRSFGRGTMRCAGG